MNTKIRKKFESMWRAKAAAKKAEATGKYAFRVDVYDRYNSYTKTIKLSAKDDVEALRKYLDKSWLGPISVEDPRQVVPTEAEEAALRAEYPYEDVFKTVQDVLDKLEMGNGDGCDFVYYIQRPDGSYLYKSDCEEDEEDWD